MNIKLREQIRSIIAIRGINQKDLAELLSKNKNKKYSPEALSRKLTRGSMTYNEVAEIADLLDFDIKFISKN